MASPVDTTVKYFTSDMPGAPVLTGQAGSLIALLDACLVNGWGVQTASSVVVAGGVATATFPSNHAGFPDAVVLVAGATPAGLNGEQKVTARGANTVQWATALADGVATGAITVKMAPAGFAKPFAGTNLAAYKSASPQAHGQFLRVNDTTTRYARVVGYETMTAISTGTSLFPTAAQVSGGYYWNKADSTDGTPVPWVIVSDGRCVNYLHAPGFPLYGDVYTSMVPFVFGDMVPRREAGDPFATLIQGALSDAIINSGHGMLTAAFQDSTIAVPRNFQGSAGAVRGVSYVRDARPIVAQLPNPISGQIEFSPIQYIDPGNGHVRAALAGIGISTSKYAEKLQLNSWRMAQMAGGRNYLLCRTGVSDVTSTVASELLCYDITGPWRK